MNLHQSKPLHYEHTPLPDGHPDMWGGYLTELAKDIAAVDVLEHLEEAQRRVGDTQGWECYMLDGGIVAWWSFRP